MNRDFLGKGWKFPVRVDAHGKIAMSEYDEDIKEAIRIILETAKLERLMRPDFGCDIHEYVFSSTNTANFLRIENTVREALMIWEPRIDVIDVKSTMDPKYPDEGRLLINIDYKVRSTNTRFNLVYPFYLKEGV
jgi:phage baseplate assembly protein W